MKSSEKFMDDFMKKLNSGEFVKDTEQKTDDGVELNEKSTEEQLKKYQDLLESELLKEV